ncbi:MAG: fructosamine kinase family protein [Candidatus Zixiibacteriota bacterium]
MLAGKSSEDISGIPQVRPGPLAWLSKPLRDAIEMAVSEQAGYIWRIKEEKDYSEFACHKCAIVSDSSFEVFFKYSDATDAKQQFEIELSNLHILSKKACVLIPEPIGIIGMNDGALLIMRALKEIKRGPDQWRQIGATLAQIHSIIGNYHGYERDGFWGPLRQDNTTTPDWITFFRERRLLPMLKYANDSGNISIHIISGVEKLVNRLPELCGPEITPTLLHGDAQQNNFISTADGTYVIDPAVYYGHPEMDLALLDSFQPVPDIVLDTYHEKIPIDPGFYERRHLWRIPLYLAAVAIEGPMHLKKLTDALKMYT